MMPNNNPSGHNQHTKSESSGSKSQESSSLAQDAGAEAAAPDDGSSGNAPSAASPAKRAGSGVSKRGFASMDEQTQRIIASKGGHSQGRENNPGNFANDRERARTAGRKGGEAHGSHR
ncbi:MAG: KGG domain-containing protein [Steroidobacteraceae bacterium]|jgi:hypothetical protein